MVNQKIYWRAEKAGLSLELLDYETARGLEVGFQVKLPILKAGFRSTVNFGCKRIRYKGFSLVRDYAKGSK